MSLKIKQGGPSGRRTNRVGRLGRWRPLLPWLGILLTAVMATAQEPGPPPLDSGRNTGPPTLDLNLPGREPGQQPPAMEARPESGTDTLVRYRFYEPYGPPEAPGEGRGSYRVAFLETIETAVEVAQAAPERTRMDYLVKYTARPAAVGGLERDQVSAVVRQYESVKVRVDGQDQQSVASLQQLDGRRLWLQRIPGPAPLVLTIGGDPPLTQEQFGFVAYQQIYVPDLSRLLPRLHVGIGREWDIDPSAAEELIGDRIVDGRLRGKLLEIQADPDGEGQRAIISITGSVSLLQSQATVNAEITFAFSPPTEGEAAPPAGIVPDARLVEAPGAVVKLRMAERAYATFAGAGGQPQQAVRDRKLLLERRFDVEGALVPTLPSPPPTPSPENSWVVYRDPENRFLFRHPQDYLPAPLGPGEEDSVHLQRRQVVSGTDDLVLDYLPGDRISPDEYTRSVEEGWTRLGVNVGRGPEGYLPEQDWPGRMVYRVERSLTFMPSTVVARAVERAYFVAYLIRFARDVSMYVRATTNQDNTAAFRDEVEQILKTVQLDPPPPAGAPASTPTPNPTPAPTPAPAPAPAPAPEAESPSTP